MRVVPSSLSLRVVRNTRHKNPSLRLTKCVPSACCNRGCVVVPPRLISHAPEGNKRTMYDGFHVQCGTELRSSLSAREKERESVQSWPRNAGESSIHPDVNVSGAGLAMPPGRLLLLCLRRSFSARLLVLLYRPAQAPSSRRSGRSPSPCH